MPLFLDNVKRQFQMVQKGYMITYVVRFKDTRGNNIFLHETQNLQ